MEQMTTVCRNPWCKATFYYTENDMIPMKNESSRNSKSSQISEVIGKETPQFCKKCQSFDKDLSGGVSWTQKNYEGSRFDNLPHEIKYKVTNYKL